MLVVDVVNYFGLWKIQDMFQNYINNNCVILREYIFIEIINTDNIKLDLEEDLIIFCALSHKYLKYRLISAIGPKLSVM